ncbi:MULTISPECIES: BTAD domain-containing putative transcriptional regulator [Microbacterium]|uniref:OmpR/PhoB-type domain-containing protein n=1 Tax=Microbacterium wangchenii TaxID=2541726 RepID=A0ABX5SSR9_9MICO|nr:MULTISPECIES: BTAD domain-containing putative transcriptional regulator [Microbacterium]MCK6067927.1 winged helix-turn-helix domain-containing protein [Microbacterium sp. EYE_512]QBR89189.1 hypothetical protein E4K62_11135 [Microbacterium wangchenii]
MRTPPGGKVDVIRPRLLRRLEAPRVLLIAGRGAGKTTLLRQLTEMHADHDRITVLALGPPHRRPAVLEDALGAVLAGRPDTIALDNAEHVVAGPAAAVLTRLLAAPEGFPRIVVASGIAPDFALARAEFTAVSLVEECELVLRLDELMALIRHELGVRVAPDTAAGILDATGGWPATVRRLLLHVQCQGPARTDGDLLDALADPGWREPLSSGAGGAGQAWRLPNPPPRADPGAAAALLPPRVFRAVQPLAGGDVVGATRLLDALVRCPADSWDAWAARLALLIIRAPLLGTTATADALFRLERDAAARGLTRLARLVRGTLGAAAALPSADAALRDTIAACAADGDAVGEAILEALALLWQLRSGVVPRERDAVLDLATRFDALGCPDVAGWITAALVLAGIEGAHLAPPELDGRRIAAFQDQMSRGARDLLAAAESEDGDRSGRLRASALRIGVPRLPAALRPIERAPRPRGAESVLHSADAPVVLTCFGSFHLRIGGRDVDVSSVRPQARTLLRLLALSAGGPVHREWIAEIIWPDLPLDSAVHALHVSVSSLRRALNAYGHGTGGRLVERRGNAYALRLDRFDHCDLVSFDSRLTAATDARARGDIDTAVRQLDGAVELYLGDVLPEDGPADWVVGTRERYRARAAEAAAALALLELRRADTSAALHAAERAVEIDPWTDAAWRALTTVHRSADDLIALARTEERYRRMLHSLGVR